MQQGTKKTLSGGFGILLIIATINNVITQPNYGFTTTWSGEALGGNLFTIALPILGIWLLYNGLKKEK